MLIIMIYYSEIFGKTWHLNVTFEIVTFISPDIRLVVCFVKKQTG